MTSLPRRPGDIILDHYVPHLAPEDREIARERLSKFTRLLLDIARDQGGTAVDNADSCGAPKGGKIQTPPPT